MLHRLVRARWQHIGWAALIAAVPSCGASDNPERQPLQQEHAVLASDASSTIVDASQSTGKSVKAKDDADLKGDKDPKNDADFKGDKDPDEAKKELPPSAAAKAVLAALRARFAGAPPKLPPTPPGPGEDPPEGDLLPDPAPAEPIELEAASPLAPGLAEAFEDDSAGLRARFPAAKGAPSARVLLSRKPTEPLQLEDTRSGAAVDITLQDALDVEAESADGFLVHQRAHASGATVMHRALPDGDEDFLSFEARPEKTAVTYRLTLQNGIAGLRLVGNTLEMLDVQGAPRLRIAPPYLVSADRALIDATLSVEGCKFDTDPAPPWDRPVTAPEATDCRVQVTWPSDGVVYPALLDPKWTTTASMSKERNGHTATVLPNGKVLVVGGTDGSTVFSSAELYDRTTGTWASAGNMNGARKYHTAVLLNTSSNPTTSGKVLIAGGASSSSTLTTAQLYSPSSGTWANAPNMNASRYQHTATLLSNGRVLVAGGVSGSTVLKTAAVYNPSSGSGSWAAVSSMAVSRRWHTATLLSTTNATLNNKVLVVGGNSGSSTQASVQLFDGTSAWTTLTSLASARQEHTATLLTDGRLLVAGGKNGSNTTLNTALLFNPASGSGSWASAGTMTSRRHGQSATLLSTAVVANGQVLLAGGWDGNITVNSAELFTAPSTWAATNSVPAPVKYHTASVLSNGMVLIAGGVEGSTPLRAAHLYDPSRGLTCSSSGQCPTGFCANGVCCDTACTDECGACNLAGLAGTCSPKASGTACADEGNPCTTDQCNGLSQLCQHPAGNAGATCRAAVNVCDFAETCSGSSASCPADGKAPSGTACDDSNVCTTADTCDGSGLCVGGPPLPVNDGNPCTTDTCGPSGPIFTPVPSGTSCADGVTCTAGTCDSNAVCVGCIPPHCGNGVRDGNETGVDCGGSCPACPGGGVCASDADCASGFVCGTNNGACFGNLPRATRVCWPATCEGGGNRNACGSAGSACGSNCACVTPCDPADAGTSCPTSEVCKARAGRLFDVPIADVCVDPRCPSNDPALCGRADSLCGATCVCTPNCSSATCANPSDGCGGLCPGVCGGGSTGCTADVNCPAGFVCIPSEDGTRTCRPGECAFRVLAPPLCGAPGAACGDQCPSCTARCDGRQCGLDPNCGQSCGPACGAGTYCSDAGQCVQATTQPPISVPDGAGGVRVVVPPPPPASPSHVGAIPGTFNVSEEGTSQYSVPIEVPPGRAGMQPAIALRYSGTRTNGDLGVGWHIDGLSQITRCPRSQSLDGAGTPVQNTVTDRFCIDGKRLEAVAGVDGTPKGADGANGTEYRTLIDSFARVVSYREEDDGVQLDPWSAIARVNRIIGGPDSFRVWTKDGRILTFGGSRDATVLSRSGRRYGWLLKRVEDRAGNTMSISYSNYAVTLPLAYSEGATTSVHPNVISYTGHGDQDGNRDVTFTYEDRIDPLHRFMQGGVPYVSDSRLQRITTHVDGVPVKNYRLVYGNGQTSQISKIFECVGDGDTNCKFPTQFEYQQESGFVWGNGAGVDDEAGRLDTNGDGIPDYLLMKTIVHPVEASPVIAGFQIGIGVVLGVGGQIAGGPAGSAAASVFWSEVGSSAFAGLFGKDPVVEFRNTLYVGTGNRNSPVTSTGNVQGLPCLGPNPSWVLDYDRDGKDDLVVACNFGFPSMNISIVRSKGDGDFEGAGVPAISLPYWDCGQQQGCPFPSLLPKPAFVDVNGDSLEDLVYCKDRNTIALRRRMIPPEGFEPQPIVVPSSFCSHGPSPTFHIFDLEGDGVPDLVFRTFFEGWKVLRFSVSNGAPTLQLESAALPDVGNSATGEGMSLTDFNGDGLMDIYKAEGDRALIWLNGSNGRFSSRQLHRPQPALSQSDPFGAFSLHGFGFADQNADGFSDIIEAWKTPAQLEADGQRRAHFFNVALRPDSAVNRLDPNHPVLLWPSSGNPNQFVPGLFQVAGDVDGDGNIDLFGNGDKAFYGSGARNGLLTKVVDGSGRLIRVRYETNNPDAVDPNTYRTDAACAGLTWPETCLKRVSGLVSTHSEGYVDSNDAEVIERSYEYNYVNARMNVTGQGWIGFDRRTVRSLLFRDPFRDVTTEYEPIAHFDQNGNRIVGGTASLEPPYLYPLAGLPKTVTIDEYPLQSLVQVGGSIENGSYIRRTKIQNIWDVRLSAFGRPFPFIDTRVTRTFDRSSTPPPPFEDDGSLLTECTEGRVPDGYGNVVTSNEQCQGNSDFPGEQTLTVLDLVPDAQNWLISHPGRISTVSTRGGGEPVGQEWSFRYDNGLLSSFTRAPENTPAQHTTTYTRGDFGNVRHILEEVATGEPPRETTISYDEEGIFPESITNALGHLTQVRFDARWGTASVTADANGIPSTRVYDGFGRLVRIDGPEGTTMITHADAFNATAGHRQQLQVTFESQGTEGSRAGAQVREYDHNGQLRKTHTEGFGGTVYLEERTYDNLGRLTSRTLPHVPGGSPPPKDVYSYDRLHRVKHILHSDNTFREYRYASSATLDAQYSQWLNNFECDGLQSCAVEFVLSIDEEGKRNAVITDHRGLIVRSIDGDNILNTVKSSNYTYGPFNRLRDARDNDNNLTHFEVDAYGRRTLLVDPDIGPSTAIYNGYDEITQSTDPKTQTRVFHYDRLGRLERIDDPLQKVTRWIYDQGVNALGRLSETIAPATTENPNGNYVLYQYEPTTPSHARGFLRQIDTGLDDTVYSVKFGYDDAGRIDRIDYPNLGNGPPIAAKYHYDTSGVLTDLDEIGSNATRPIWQLEETFQGHLVQRESFGNGASTIYGYDPERRWLDSIQTTLGAGVAQQFAYSHYGNGLLRNRTTSTEQREHTYDEINRLSFTTDTLTGGTTVTKFYGYDAIGNITRRDNVGLLYMLGKPHLLQSANANSYVYDPNGNVSQRGGSDIPGGVQNFEYTPFDLPSSITTGSGAAARTTLFEYTADAVRAIRRDPDTTRHFVGDLYQRVVTTGTSSTVEERFALYAGGRQLSEVVRKNGNDETLFFHTDRQSSVSTITTGNLASHQQVFDSFGAAIDPPTPEVTRAGFTGHEHDNDLGLIDMKGRIYDPFAGRFTSADPIIQAPFFSQGLNRYSYVFNDPVNNVDPSGFFGEDAYRGVLGILRMGYGSSGGGAAVGSLLGGLLGGVGGGVRAAVAPGLGGGSPGATYSSAPMSTRAASSVGTNSTHAAAQNRDLMLGQSTTSRLGPKDMDPGPPYVPKSYRPYDCGAYGQQACSPTSRPLQAIYDAAEAVRNQGNDAKEEYVSIVYVLTAGPNAGKFSYTKPVTIHRPDRVSPWRAEIHLPPGAQPVQAVHNHPAARWTDDGGHTWKRTLPELWNPNDADAIDDLAGRYGSSFFSGTTVTESGRMMYRGAWQARGVWYELPGLR
jgi:RHS repeat-associated protein